MIQLIKAYLETKNKLRHPVLILKCQTSFFILILISGFKNCMEQNKKWQTTIFTCVFT